MKRTPLEDWVMSKAGITERKRDLLENYQLERARAVLRYAQENSRFYGAHLHGIEPGKIDSFGAFRRIPFTYPRQLSADPLSFLCLPPRGIKRIVTLKSSGTSGAEKRIYFSQVDLDLTVDFFQSGMNCLLDAGDRVLVFLPGNSYGSIGELLKRALEGTPCFVHGVIGDEEEAARFIIENGITCLVGIPIQILRLSRAKSESFQGIKKVLLSADYVPGALIAELTERFGCRVFTHYGMTEMGYGGGVECEALNGYHMREADLYFEIVDPESGKPVEDGQSGEVVFTTLTPRAMPLIRYRTGDISSFAAAPCACGTFLKTMSRVRGRADNRVRFSAGRFLSLADLDELILPYRAIRDYRAYIREENSLCLELAVESDGAYEELQQKIGRRVREWLCANYPGGPIPAIEVSRKNKPDSMANSMVKRRLWDMRPAGAGGWQS